MTKSQGRQGHTKSAKAALIAAVTVAASIAVTPCSTSTPNAEPTTTTVTPAKAVCQRRRSLSTP
jgi:hypothetical protein